MNLPDAKAKMKDAIDALATVRDDMRVIGSDLEGVEPDLLAEFGRFSEAVHRACVTAAELNEGLACL